MPPKGFCFFSLHVLPVCLAAGWCPCWRRCQPEQQPRRPSQRQLYIQHRTQPPVGNIQRSDAHCSPVIRLTQHDMRFSVYFYVFMSVFAFNRSYVRPGWPAACRPGAEGGETGQGWDAWQPLPRQFRWWEWQKRHEDTQSRHTHKVRTRQYTNTKYFPKVK